MKRFLMLAVTACLFVPFMSNAATLIIQEVRAYSDGTPIPAEKVKQIRYRYYYGDNESGPFIEGTATVDNLVLSVPGPASLFGNKMWYTVDATLDNASSAKATMQVLPAPSSPSGGGGGGCSMARI